MITFLREVHLASNQLSNFPLAFCALPNLDLLNLSNNLITTIPPEISSLHALELNLNNNKVIAPELLNFRMVLPRYGASIVTYLAAQIFKS